MKRLLFGVIGHVDHGKTALVRALTGTETDRLEEERRRGISIALGFAHAPLAGAEIDFIDMPGHERFVRTMVSGATGIDAVLLVVAANEGVKPQTREHLAIAALLGIRHAVIAVTKRDLVTAAQATARGREVAALVAQAGLAAATPVTTAAPVGEGVAELARALAAVEPEARADDGFAFLAVDRAFSLAGHGTVVTGTLRHGDLATGAVLTTMPSGRAIRIRGLQVHGRSVPAAAPGQRVALNLRGVEVTEVSRGTTLTRDGPIAPSSWLTVELFAVAGAPVLVSGARLRLLHGTSDLAVRVRLLDRDRLEGGERCFAQLRCESRVAVPARDRFVLRVDTPPATVAGGRVLDPIARRERRHAASLLDRLAALAATGGSALVAGEIERAAGRGITLDRLASLAGIAVERVARWVTALPVVSVRGDRVVHRPAFDRLLAQLPPWLAKQMAPDAPGLSIEQIAARSRVFHPDVIAAAVAQLVRQDLLRQEGGLVRPPRPAQEREAARREDALAERIEAGFRAAGLTPPTLAGVSPDPQAARIANRLVRDGVLVRTLDRVQKREILFHRDAIADARRRLLAALRDDDGLLLGELGAVLGISRKYAVPLFEHLDAIGITRRVKDRRMLGPAAAIG